MPANVVDDPAKNRTQAAVTATQAKSRSVPGQMGLWERCQVQTAFSLPVEVQEVADRFFRAGFAWP